MEKGFDTDLDFEKGVSIPDLVMDRIRYAKRELGMPRKARLRELKVKEDHVEVTLIAVMDRGGELEITFPRPTDWPDDWADGLRRVGTN